jgi:hypothetical protein
MNLCWKWPSGWQTAENSDSDFFIPIINTMAGWRFAGMALTAFMVDIASPMGASRSASMLGSFDLIAFAGQVRDSITAEKRKIRYNVYFSAQSHVFCGPTLSTRAVIRIKSIPEFFYKIHDQPYLFMRHSEQFTANASLERRKNDITGRTN